MQGQQCKSDGDDGKSERSMPTKSGWRSRVVNSPTFQEPKSPFSREGEPGGGGIRGADKTCFDMTHCSFQYHDTFFISRKISILESLAVLEGNPTAVLVPSLRGHCYATSVLAGAVRFESKESNCRCSK